MKKIKDMRNVRWNTGIGSMNTGGCYFKAKIVENGLTNYYKLPAFNSFSGFYGNEAVNEVIVSRLSQILGFNCVKYTLNEVIVSIDNREYITQVCKSPDYMHGFKSRQPLENFYSLNRIKYETPEKMLTRLGFQEDLNKLLICDFIIINRDRHGANIEILRDSAGKYSMSPIFDNGLSFICSITKDLSKYTERVMSFDSLSDIPVNNYMHSRSLYTNLELIDNPVRVCKLTKEHKKKIFYGLNKYIDSLYRDKIWEIIVYRYSYLRKRGLIVEV